MENLNILVIGSINIDIVLGITNFPENGESIYGTDFFYSPGGKGSNQAVACARIGADVTFVGNVGDDNHAEILLSKLQSENINTTYVKKHKQNVTGLAAILLSDDGSNRIISYSGANNLISLHQLKDVFQNHYDVLILQFELPQKIIIECTEMAKKHNIPVVIDAGPAQQFSLKKLQNIIIFTPNETETYALTGIELINNESIIRAAHILKEQTSAKYIVIKLGSKGCYLLCDTISKFYKPYDVEVIDTTAAGDSFTAALTYYYLLYNDIEKAITYANICGTLAVTKKGALDCLPYKSEIEKFCEINNIGV